MFSGSLQRSVPSFRHRPIPDRRIVVFGGGVLTGGLLAACSAPARTPVRPLRAIDEPGLARIRQTLLSGGEAVIDGLILNLSSPLVLNGGAVLRGAGWLVPGADFRGGWAVELREGGGARISGIKIDGEKAGDAVISGVRAQGSVTDLRIENCLFRNLSFDGLDLSGGAGQFRHRRIAIIDNRVENTGWIGLNIEATTDGQITGNTVSRTGYHGLCAVTGCEGVRISDNRVSKAKPPSRIYSGEGGLGGKEGGFLIGFDQTVRSVVIDSNLCEDNRNAGYDGIGVGEDGSEFGRVTITRNIVRHAGLFGIDAPGNCLVAGNLVEAAAQQGIHVGLDLGGLIRNVEVRDNILRDVGVGDAESFGILVGDTLGMPVRIENVRIQNNVVTDSRTSGRTRYGLGLVHDEARYADIEITDNDFLGVERASVMVIGRPQGRNGIQGARNRCLPPRDSLCGPIG